MVMLIHRRQALVAIGAAALFGTPTLTSAPARGAEVSSKYADFTGVWLVDRGHHRPGGRRGSGERDGRRGPPPFGRDGGRFGPGPGGPGGSGGPETEDIKIEGVNVPGLDRGDRRVYEMMTAEGKAAFAAMDAHDLPANQCKSPGLPSIVMTPNLQDWRQVGDTLTIHHEYYDTHRIIHLDRRGHPANAGHTQLGDAVSWMDGNMLVIETADLAATPGGLGRNAPSSDARMVVERYRLSPDRNTLYGEITMTDPKYLTQPITVYATMQRQPAGTKIEIAPCSIEAAQDYLDHS